MPTTRGYRLVVRSAADDADELILSGVAGAENPYLTADPSIDGASIDPITGSVDVGAATVRVWDEVISAATPAVARESWDALGNESGAPNYLHTAWPAVNGGAYAGAWSVEAASAPFTAVTEGTKALRLLLGDVAGSGSGRVSVVRHTFAGLTPAQPARLAVDVRETLRTGGATNVLGLRVGGAAASTAFGPGAAGAGRVTLEAVAAGDGTLTVDVGALDWSAGASYGYSFDRLTVFPADAEGEERVVTRLTHDEDARVALLSRRCRVEASEDGGDTWTPVHRGYLNELRLADAGEWEATVGDTTRQEQQTELWTALPLDPVPAGLLVAQPRVGLLIGGPITADPTYGPFAGQRDYGSTRWAVQAVYAGVGASTPRTVVRLKFLQGPLRPWYDGIKQQIDEDEFTAINAAASGFFAWDAERYRPPSYDTYGAGGGVIPVGASIFGAFPALQATLTPVGGGAPVAATPVARPTPFKLGDSSAPNGDYDNLVGSNEAMYVEWPEGLSAPAGGAQYDLVLHGATISDENPLLLAGHPVDLVAYACALSGVPVDDASRFSVRAAIGEGLWYEDPAVPEKLKAFTEAYGGAFGFVLVPDAETGARRFVPTRVLPGSAAFTITDADRRDTGDGGAPVVWEATEDSVVTGVDFNTRRLRPWRFKVDEGTPPLSTLATSTYDVEGARLTGTVNGDRTQRYALRGQVMWRAADGSVVPLTLATGDPDAPGWAEQAGGVIIDQAGWGVKRTVVALTGDSPAAAAKLGDIASADLSDLPVPLVGATPVTARGQGPVLCRVVKVTPAIADGGVDLELEHLGQLSQDALGLAPGGDLTGAAVVPTYTVAASTAAPQTIGTVTLTNGAYLEALGLSTELEYLAQAATPSADTHGTAFGPVPKYAQPDGNLTTIDAPAVPAGSKLWVRARSRAYGGVTSDWGAWQSVQLGTVQNGGATAGEAAQAPPAPQLTITFDGSGTPTATAKASAGTALLKVVLSASSIPADATVRADAGAVPSGAGLRSVVGGFTKAEGATAYAAAYAVDALGNESQKATATATRGTAPVDTSAFAPAGADYLVRTAHATLTAERVVTDTATVSWDWLTAGQAKAIVADASITAAKLAARSVTAAKLDATGATAGHVATAQADGSVLYQAAAAGAWRVSLTRALPTVVGDYVELGQLDFPTTYPGGVIRVTLGGTSAAVNGGKAYVIPLAYFTGSGHAFEQVTPLFDAPQRTILGATSLDFALEARFNGNDVTLRVRRTLGTGAGTLEATVEYAGRDAPPEGWTALTGTGTSTVSTTVARGLNLTATAPLVYAAGTQALTHAASGATPGTYGSATKIPIVEVNATGHVVAVTEITASGAGSGGSVPGVTDPTYGGSYPADSTDFAGTGLDASVVALNLGTAATLAVANGYLEISYTPASGADALRGVTRASPSGAWEFETLAECLGGAATYLAAYLGVRRAGGTAPNAANVTTDKWAAYGVGAQGSSRLFGQTSNSSTSGTSGVLAPSGIPVERAYLRVAYDGSTGLTWKASRDRVRWVTMQTLNSTTVLGGAPDSLVLGAYEFGGTAPMYARFYYWWRNS